MAVSVCLSSRISHRFCRSGCILTNRLFSEHADSSLETYINNSLSNYKELRLRPIRILGLPCNVGLGASFSQARVKHKRYNIPPNNEKVHVKFSNIFSKGFDDLEDYTNRNVRMFETSGADPLLAVTALRTFLSELDKHEQYLREALDSYSQWKENSETYIASLLTIHLLSCLVYGNQYKISSDYRYRPAFCPCFHKDCRKELMFGQTSLGHEDLWFGRPDVVLIPKQDGNSNMVPIFYYDETMEKNEEIEDVHPLEFNGSKDEFECFPGQIFSQAIICAFYLSNVMEAREMTPLTTLVPSIVLTPNHYYIIMYDYVNDILLSSGHQDSCLWDETGCSFNSSAILHIWMALNYKDFLPSLDCNVVHRIAHSSNVHNILQNYNLLQETKKIQQKSSFIPIDVNDDDDDEDGTDLNIYVNS